MVLTSPFGRYSEIVTTIVTVFIIVAAVATHAIPWFSGIDTQFLDAAAWIALGAIFGKVSAANGYANMALQAHARLDAIGAPGASAVAAGATGTSTSTSSTISTSISSTPTP